jgi:hypothetical protein
METLQKLNGHFRHREGPVSLSPHRRRPLFHRTNLSARSRPRSRCTCGGLRCKSLPWHYFFTASCSFCAVLSQDLNPRSRRSKETKDAALGMGMQPWLSVLSWAVSG